MYYYPFTPVVGEGLGVSYSSLNRNGKILSDRRIGQAEIEIFVNLANGNLIIADHFIKAEERSGVIELGYFYNGLNQTWQWNIPRLSILNKNQLIITENDGHQTSYNYDKDRTCYYPPICSDGRPYIKIQTDGTYFWFDPKSGTKKQYDAQGLLRSISDAAGRTSIFNYNSAKQLDHITGPTGNRYEVRRSSNQTSIYLVENGEETLLQTYIFDQGLLKQTIIGPKQKYTVTYGYVNNVLSTVSQTDNTRISFQYQPNKTFQNVITQIQIGDTEIYDVTYVSSTSTLLENELKQKVTMTFDNNLWLKEVRQNSGIISRKQPDAVTQYSYTNDGQVSEVIKPNGAKWTYLYDTLKLLSSGQGPDNQSFYKAYDQNTGALLEKIEYLTDDPGSLGKFLSTYYVYDQNYNNNPYNRVLRFVLSPSGHVTEYTYNANGDMQTQRIYFYQSFDLKSYRDDEQPTLQAVEKWVKDYTNLNPTGIGLTEYVYNERGQIKNVKQYSEIDNNNALTTESQYQKNYFGQWTLKSEKQQQEYFVQTQRVFDDLLRIDQEIKGIQEKSVKQTTQYIYNYTATQAIHSIIYPNERIESNQLENRGYVIQKKENAIINDQMQSRLTTYMRDSVGRLILTMTPDQQKHFSFYDLQDRLIYEVNSLGKVTEHFYDTEKCYHVQIDYANEINLDQLQPYPDILPSPNNLYHLIVPDLKKDRYHYQFFDKNNWLRFEVDKDSFLTETRYNSVGLAICEISYAIAITSELLALLKDDKLVITPDVKIGDRVWNSYYDDDLKLLAKINPAGYVLENKRDSASRVTKSIQYATPCSTLGITNRNFDEVRPKSNEAEDAHNYYLFDGLSLCVATIDAENYLTKTSYYANQKPATKTRFATQVNNKTSRVMENLSQLQPVPDPKRDDEVKIFFDGLNRQSRKQHANRKIVVTSYDKMDQIISLENVEENNTISTDPDKRRASLKRYDQWQQCVAECLPMTAQKLAEIEADPNIVDKKAAEEKVWKNMSRRYLYDPTGLKIIAIDALNKQTLYFYNSLRMPVLIIKPNGAVTELTYNTFDEIISSRQYATALTAVQIAQLKLLNNGFITPQIKALLIPSDNDIVDQFDYDKRGHQILHIDPEGFITENSVDAFNQIVGELLPVDDKLPSLKIEHKYELRGLEIETIHSAGNLAIRTVKEYGNFLGKVTIIIDEEEISHVFKYDRLGNKTHIYAPDGTLLHKCEFDAYGEIKSDQNALKDITTYDFDLPSRIRITTPPVADTQSTTEKNIFNEQVKFTNALGYYKKWQHAPNAKIAKLIQQINSTYDSVFSNDYNLEGLLDFSVDPTGIKTQINYDDNGEIYRNIVDVDHLAYATTYNRDTFSRPMYITNPRNIITKNEFDKRSLVLKKIRDYGTEQKPGLRLIEQTQYNGQKTQTNITQGDEKKPDQYQINFLTDQLNRPIGKIIDPGTSNNNLNLSQLNKLDRKGRVVVHQDPKKQSSYLFFDEFDNKRFKVDADGGITEWQYNSMSQVTHRQKYQQKLNVAQLNDQTTLEQLIALVNPLKTKDDTYHDYFYDANGRIRFIVTYFHRVDNDTYNGFLVENVYDGANQVVKEIGYADALDASLMQNLSYQTILQFTTKNTNPFNRITYTVRDAAGQERFYIDPVGAIVEQIFDPKGRIICRKKYASMILDPKQREEIAKLPPDKIQIPSSDEDRITYTVFDIFDKPNFIIDGELGVTFYQHDANINLVTQCHFKAALPQPIKSYEDLVQKCYALTPDPSQDSITQYEIDSADRMHITTDPKLNQDIFEHDALNNMISHTDRASQIWAFEYDRAKRLVLKTAPPSGVSSLKWNNQGLLEPLTLFRSVQEFYRYDNNNNVEETIKDYSKDNSTDSRHLISAYTPVNGLAGTTIPDCEIDDVTKPANFNQRPTKKVDLTTKSVYDGKKREVCSKDQRDKWSFNVYDSAERLAYAIKPDGTVIGYERDVFGDVILKREYSTRLTINLNQYITTGVPIEVVYANIQTIQNNNDRMTIFKRDNRGDIINLIKDEVLYYYPGSAQPRMANPIYNYQNNAFRERIFIEKVRFPEYPQLNYKKRQWYDRNGNTLAEGESIQSQLVDNSLLTTPIEYRVNRYFYYTSGQEKEKIEYANSVKKPLTVQMTLKDLDAICNSQLSVKDRKTTKDYDVLQRLITETRVGVIRQEISVGKNIRTTEIYSHVKDEIAKLERSEPDEKKKPELKGEPVKHFTGRNPAVEEFLGKGVPERDQRLFFNWYSSEICLQLMNLVENKSDCLIYLFNDTQDDNNQQSFNLQFIHLQKLADHFKKPSVFICKEPGVTNHFVMGCYFKNRLLLINPLGIPDDLSKISFYKILADLQKQIKLDIWLSSVFLQFDPPHSLVSCGPIVLEAALHFISHFSSSELRDLMCISLVAKEPVSFQKLTYYTFALNAVLPQTLKYHQDIMSYPKKILAIRQSHYRLLKELPEQYASQVKLQNADVLSVCQNSPVQCLVQRMALENINLELLFNDESYQDIDKNQRSLVSLLQRLAQKRMKDTENKIEEKLPENLPSVHDTARIDVSVSYAYTPTGHQWMIQDENGTKKYKYFDQRGFCIAHTDFPFTSNQQQIPLTYSAINAHGQQIMTQRFVNGAKDISLNPTIVPIPRSIDLENDQISYNLYDNRGLISFKQNPKNDLQGETYSGTRKLERLYYKLTNYDAVSSTQYVQRVHIDEKRWHFTDNDLPDQMTWLRDSDPKEFTTQVYNAFGEETEEGGSESKQDSTNPVYSNFNKLGQLFNTNKSGHAILSVYDLLGQLTANLEAPKTDLKNIATEDQIIPLFDYAQFPDVELTGYWPDPCNRVLRRLLPPFMARSTSNNPNDIPKIELCLQVSHLYQEQIGNLAVTWLKLPDTTLKPKFYLKQIDAPNPVELKIKEQLGIQGVDVSNWITDIYHFQIDFIFTDPITNKDKIMYRSTGIIQFDSGIYQQDSVKSKEVVTSMQEGHVLWLYGNVETVTAIELYSNEVLINQFPITQTSNPNQIFVDLKNQKDHQGKDLISGLYRIKSVRGNQVDKSMSLFFTLYTDKPAFDPLAREIPCQAQLITSDDNGELSIWNSLPEDYRNKPVFLQCLYDFYVDQSLRGGDLNVQSAITEQAFNQAISDWISANSSTNNVLLIRLATEDALMWNVCGRDGNNQMVNQQVDPTSAFSQILLNIDPYNVSQPQKIILFRNSIYQLGRAKQVFEQMTVEPNTKLKYISDKNADQMIANIHFQHIINEILSLTVLLVLDSNDAIVLYKQANPITTQNIYLKEKIRDGYHIFETLKSVAVPNRVSAEILQSPNHCKSEQITTWQFDSQVVLYITPLANLNKSIQLPVIKYFDITGGLNSVWKELQALGANNVGVMFNVTDLAPANYFYSINQDSSFNKVFSVTGGGEVYTSDPGTQPTTVKTNVLNDSVFDVYNNKIMDITTSQGKSLITEHEINDLNKETKTKYPATTVVYPNGTRQYNVITTREIGYNKKGEKISTTDPNNFTELFTLDTAGKCIAHVLGDGTIASQSVYNALNQKIEYKDARGAMWQLQYDRTNQTIKSTSPPNPTLINTYSYDEKDNRVSEVDPAYKVTLYGHDIKGYNSLRVDSLNQLTQMQFHRTGKMTKQTNPDGLSLWWDYDYMGNELSHTLLDGTKITNHQDKKGQLTLQTSTGGQPRQNMAIVPYSFTFMGQQLSFYRTVVTPVPPRYLVYSYQGGLLIQVQDVTQGKSSTYLYDEMMRCIHRSIVLDNGELVRVMDAQYDELGRQSLVHDTNATMVIEYDASGNRRHQFAEFTCGILDIRNDYWSTFDAANRVLVDQGALDNQVIKIKPGQGLQLSYLNNFRHTESQDLGLGTVVTTLNYDGSGRLLTTYSTDNTSTSRIIDNSDCVQRYSEATSLYNTRQDYSFNGALQQNYNQSFRNTKWEQRSEMPSFTKNNNPIVQRIYFPEHSEQVELTNWYLQLESELITTVTGNTSWIDDKGKKYSRNLTPANLYYDANCNPNGKVNSDDGQEGSGDKYVPEMVYFSTTHDGIILRKRHMTVAKNPLWFDIFFEPGLFSPETLKDEFVFVDPNNQIFATYLAKTDPRQSIPFAQFGMLNLAGIRGGLWANISGGFAGALFGMGSTRGKQFMITDPIQALVEYPRPYTFMDYMSFVGGKDPKKGYENSVPAPMSSYPPVLPQRYTVPHNNMSLFDIAVAATNSIRNAAALAEANNCPISKFFNAGDLVKIPQLQMNTNSYLDNPNYQKLMSLIIGSLSPHIDFKQPKQHHSCLKIIVAVVISVVALTIGAWMAPAIFGALFGAIGAAFGATAIGAAVGTALIDAALQGIAVGIGALDKFSWTDVLEVAVQAGLGQYFKLQALMQEFGNEVKSAEMSKAMMSLMKIVAINGAINATQQLAEIAVGIRHKFDIRSVVTAMANTAIDLGISAKLPTSDVFLQKVEKVFEDFANTLVGDAIMGTPMRFQNWVAQELGSEIGSLTGDFLLNGIQNYDLHHFPSLFNTEVSPKQAYYTSSTDGQGMSDKQDYFPKPPQDAYKDTPQNYQDSVTNTSNKPITSSNQNRLNTVNQMNINLGTGLNASANEFSLYQYWSQHNQMGVLFGGNAGTIAVDNSYKTTMPQYSNTTMKVAVFLYDHQHSWWGQAILLDMKLSNYVMNHTIVGSAVDMVLNTRDTTSNFLPVTLFGKGLFEAAFGYNPFTGQRTSIGQAETNMGLALGAELGAQALASLRVPVTDLVKEAVPKISKMVSNSFATVSENFSKLANKFGFLGKSEINNVAVNKNTGLTSRLNRKQIIDYLSNVENISRQELIKDLESVGIKLKGEGRGGEFMEFADKQGNIRVKIHPPDRSTLYSHMHIYDKSKNPLNANLDIVPRRSPDAHIEIQELNSPQNAWSPEW